MKTANEPLLHTERLLFRRIQEYDWNDIIEMYSDKEMFRYTNSDMDLNADSFPIEKTQALSMIESWEKDDDLLCWGIVTKREKKLIGRVYLYDMIGNESAGYRVSIGYSISTKHSGYGYATEAVMRVVEYGFTELNVIRFQAEILPENVASVRVCTKARFRHEGTLHKYAFYNNNGNCFKDIVMMGLSRN